MLKRDYFLQATRAGAYRRNAWVLRAFAKSNMRELSTPEYPYELMLNKEGQMCFFDPATEQVTLIDDVPKKRALFSKLEGIHIEPGELANVKTKIYTTYGNVLWNAIALIDVFGDRMDFITGKVDAVKVEKAIAKVTVDDVEEGAETPGTIYVKDLIKHTNNVSNLGGYNQLFVPSATKYTMTAAPKAKARLKELLEEHKDELNDPVVIAKIWKEVAVLDREYLDEDPDKGFIQKGKTVDVVRKRLFYMFGIEADFGGTGSYTFIERPLSEGLDISKLPEMSNTVREGSFNRGALTAMGGEKFKRIIQAMAGSNVTQEDCGSKAYETFELTANNINLFYNSYMFDDSGELKLFTEDEHKGMVGKTVNFRSPAYCNTTEGNYCIKCVGEFIRGRESALAMLASDIGSTLMLINMAMMHGKVLRTVRLDIDKITS